MPINISKLIKETSSLAIAGFTLVLVCWSIPFIEIFLPLPFVPCQFINYGCMAGALMGLLSLIFIKKNHLKGRWLAILSISLGAFGFIAISCLVDFQL